MNIKHYKQDNYNLNILQTKKFKTTRVQITFANDLAKETSTKRALLPYLMKSVTTKYPNRADLQIHLDDMYSANFGAGIKKVGLSQIIVFDLSIINNKYTFDNENLLIKGMNFLKEVIFNPLFTENIFNEEKRLLNEYFQGIYANKMRYAIKQTFTNMYKNETFGVEAFGNEEDLQKLTIHDCEIAYKDMLQNDLININVVGDVELEEVKEVIASSLPFHQRKKSLVLIDDSSKPKRNPLEIFESQNVNQGKVVFGYQYPVYYQTDEYYKAIVLNALIGGGPESLLFKRIREELSLVYFIGSVYDHYKGSFVIYAGINQFDYHNVLKEVNNTFKQIINQKYEDKALIIAKKSIISGLIQSLDSNSSLITRINNLSLFNREFDQEKLVSRINSVTKDDLSQTVKLVKEDIRFLLRNDNLENN